MKTRMILVAAIAMLLTFGSGSKVLADTFGTGENQFTLDFVPISGATNPTSGYGIVNYDYRMGTCEITNAQWDKFKAAYGPVTGDPLSAYANDFYDGGTGTTDVPTNEVSWYEAAQFVNWLNTSTGHQAAYKFTGTQGTRDYTFATWDPADAWDGTNLYRHKDAFYFLPTEDEWVKAAYWNGTSLQPYATKAGESLTRGDGSGTGWNYYDNGYATDPRGTWTVGSGSQELNGTYDMMGNVWEWMESPRVSGDYNPGSSRRLRGGWWGLTSTLLHSSYRDSNIPTGESGDTGFRVASVPEPGSITLLLCVAAAAMMCRRRRK